MINNGYVAQVTALLKLQNETIQSVLIIIRLHIVTDFKPLLKHGAVGKLLAYWSCHM